MCNYQILKNPAEFSCLHVLVPSGCTICEPNPFLSFHRCKELFCILPCNGCAFSRLWLTLIYRNSWFFFHLFLFNVPPLFQIALISMLSIYYLRSLPEMMSRCPVRLLFTKIFKRKYVTEKGTNTRPETLVHM